MEANNVLLDNFMNEIRLKIKVIRTNKKLAYTELSRLCGINPIALSDFENGKSNINLRNLFKIINGFGYNVDYKEVNAHISRVFKARAIELGYSHSILEKILKTSSSQIHRLFNNKSSMTLETYAKTCVGLKLSLYEPYKFEELELVTAEEQLHNISYDGCPKFDEKYLDLEWGQPNSCYVVKEVEVLDGDTLRAQFDTSRKIRLPIVNAPEYSNKKEKFGLIARQYIDNIVSRSKGNIIIQLDSEDRIHDRFRRFIAHVWVKLDGEYKLLDYMLTRAGLCTLEYIDKVGNLYYDYYIDANKKAIEEELCIYNVKCIDTSWDYYNDQPKFNKIGIRVITVDGDTRYVMPLDYYLTKYELVKSPCEFRLEDDALSLKNRLFRDKSIESSEVIVF